MIAMFDDEEARRVNRADGHTAACVGRNDRRRGLRDRPDPSAPAPVALTRSPQFPGYDSGCERAAIGQCRVGLVGIDVHSLEQRVPGGRLHLLGRPRRPSG